MTRTVALNVQMPVGGAVGGVEQAVRGLVDSLREAPGDLRYLVLTGTDLGSWPVSTPEVQFVAPPRRLRPSPFSRGLSRWRAEVRSGLLRLAMPGASTLSDWLRAMAVDLVHFPYQSYHPVDLPHVFNPWDLQHRHLPELFEEAEREARDAVYRQACAGARAIVVATHWTRHDLVASYGVPSDKVVVIPCGILPRTGPRQEMPDDSDPFILYPAQTFQHKNHLGLLEALALVRKKHGLRLRCVCTGRRTLFFPTIAARLAALDLTGQVEFRGYVTASEMGHLYSRCRFLVYPSLFEGFGLPVVEAFAHDTPVACSRHPVLQEVVGDAALLFDGEDAESTADALFQLWDDADLRAELRARGVVRRAAYAWEPIAGAHRALYRHLLGGPPSSADEEALNRFGNADFLNDRSAQRT